MRKRRIVISVFFILFFLISTCPVLADWFEDFESYIVVPPDNITYYIDIGIFWEDQPGVPWSAFGPYEHAYILDPNATYPLFTSYVPVVGGNHTKMLCEQWYGPHAWYHRPIGTVSNSDTVTVTAEVAVAGPGVHPVWPVANHIMVGGVAIGISGNRISYGRILEGETPSGNPVDPYLSVFRPVGDILTPNTWYEVKIVYYQIPGDNNDVADLYYRTKGQNEWSLAVNNYPANSGLGTNICWVGENGPKEYFGFTDNINVSITPKQCGELGVSYLMGDANHDCRINFKDIAIVAEYWSQCNDPEVSLCQ